MGMPFEAVIQAIKKNTISPQVEAGAYEKLWLDPNITTFKRFSDYLKGHGYTHPSEAVSEQDAYQCFQKVAENLNQKLGEEQWGVRIRGTADYPASLEEAEHPLSVIYYQGCWDLAFTDSVAVVGTRSPSEEGKQRTKKIVQWLVENGYTIASGLAEGVDTVAHRTALALGGRTFAVIGTPLSEFYPKENSGLQHRIANDFLIISQIPVLRYYNQTFKVNRFFFPERNKTMSALSKATIIVEAGETSGTLTQADAAIKQGRKVLILDNCFQNQALTWPEKYVKKGAIRIHGIEDLKQELSTANEVSKD
jgi:DNA processing protein